MKKHIILLAIIGAILAGCSFEFESDNFIDLEQPITNTQYIELINFINLDTINEQRTLRYNFNGLDNQTTVTSEVYLNNEHINASWEGQFGTFILRPESYEDGTYTLRIEHTFTSGSGSIADQAGLELIQETAVFQFVVNRAPSLPPEVLSATIRDGTIFIEWATDYEMDYINAYLNIRFKSREVNIPLSNGELAMGIYNDQSTVFFQGDSNTPNFDEYSTVTYSILFESEYGNTSGASQTISYDPSMATTEIVFVDFNSYQFKWSAHPLYANFETFEFSFAEGQFTGSSQGGEYLVQSSYVFGQDYQLNGRPLVMEQQLPYYSYRDIPLSTQTFGEFQIESLFVKEILFNPATNHYYALIIENRTGSGYEFSIYEYSDDMEFLQKSSLITYNNVRYEYLGMVLNPFDNNINIDARGSAYKMDATTLQILEEYRDPPLNSELLYRGDILARLDYVTNQLTVTNIATNTVLYSDTSPSSRLGYISPDGNYIFIYGDTGNFLYRIDGNILVQVFDFTSINWSGSMEVFEDTLFYGANNEIVIFDLSTNATKSFSFGSTQQSVQFDSLSQQLLVSQNGQNAVYSTVTEEIIRFQSEDDKQAIGTFNQEDRRFFMRLWNGRLIHSKGIYIDIN